MTSKPTLWYFDFAFWKVEPARIAYFMSGTEFEDRRLTREEQQDLKNKGVLPFDQVPILFVNDKSVTQGTAICRYAGKQTGLYPLDDFESAKVDEVLNLCEEAQTWIGPSLSEQDEEKKKVMRKNFSDEKLPLFLSRLEKLLSLNGKTFFVGYHMTIADLAVWRICDWFGGGKLDYVDSSQVKKYEKLNELRKAVDSHPKIIQWKKKFPALYV